MIDTAHLRREGEDVNWLAAAVHDLALPNTPRVRASAGCLALAMEHHHSIVALCEIRLFGSAFALVRVEFEAYVRGLWLSICARNRQIGEFLRNIEPPRIGTMIEELEANPEFSSLVLSKVKRSMWRSMCAYTHTGGLHVQRWSTPDHVQPNYDDAEVLEVLAFARAISFLAGLRIAGLANDNILANRILERFEAPDE